MQRWVASAHGGISQRLKPGFGDRPLLAQKSSHDPPRFRFCGVFAPGRWLCFARTGRVFRCSGKPLGGRVADHPQDENSAPNQADARPPSKDAHLAKGVAGAEVPVDDYPRKTGKRDRERRRPVVDLGDGPPRRARHGGQAQPEDAAELEPEGRLRLPELRLARSGRRPQDRRVLRERRQGGRERGDARAHHAGVLRAALDRRAARSRAICGWTSRAGSRIRWCGGAAPTTTSRSRGPTRSR